MIELGGVAFFRIVQRPGHKAWHIKLKSSPVVEDDTLLDVALLIERFVFEIEVSRRAGRYLQTKSPGFVLRTNNVPLVGYEAPEGRGKSWGLGL